MSQRTLRRAGRLPLLAPILGLHHVPVHRNHPVAHIHIPKTAGTAIERQFAELGDMHWNASSWYRGLERFGHERIVSVAT